MKKTTYLLTILAVLVSLSACGSQPKEESKEATGTSNAALQFSDGTTTFGYEGELRAYPNINDPACDDDDTDETFFVSETVEYGEAVEIEAFALEVGEWCFYAVPEFELWYDSNEDNEPDTKAEGATLETNPIGPITFSEGVPTEQVSFTVLWPVPVVDEEYSVTTVGFTVDTDCPDVCQDAQICGRLNSDLTDTMACYDLCTNNGSCDDDELCIRGPNINAVIDVEVGTMPTNYEGVCAGKFNGEDDDDASDDDAADDDASDDDAADDDAL